MTRPVDVFLVFIAKVFTVVSGPLANTMDVDIYNDVALCSV